MLSLGIFGMVVVLVFGCTALYAIALAVYNIYFHPLSKYPGPKLFAVYRLPFVYYTIQGQLPFKVKAFHDKYGPIVRIAPSELAFISAQAWRDIYGHRQGLEQNPKDVFSYLASDSRSTPYTLLLADDKKHSRQRSQLSHAFSTKALQEQQPIISKYVDILIRQLHAKASERPQDMTAWFNWATFDIMSDLTFGKSFDCLEKASYHPWVALIFEGVLAGITLAQVGRYWMSPNIEHLIPAKMYRPREEMFEYSMSQMDKRLELGLKDDRPDFTTFMLRGTQKGDPAMTREELYANAELLVIAGSETTATHLSGLTYLLLAKRPDCLAKAIEEVRSSFSSDGLEEMNFRTVSQRLPYMIACMNEALRIYPPLPFGLARVVPSRGTNIDGQFLPTGTSISVFSYAANHSARNWYKPDEFLPERWLPEKERSEFGDVFSKDDPNSMRPFSTGPRVCLGRNLAEVESRLIYARVLWNFDLELVDGGENWMEDQSAYQIWKKTPLKVLLKPVRRPGVKQ